MDDFAVLHGDEREYGDIVIGACDYCQLVVRVTGHLVCAFGDAKRNGADDGIVAQVDNLDAAIPVSDIQLIATWDVKQAIGSRRGLVNDSLDDHGASQAGYLT